MLKSGEMGIWKVHISYIPKSEEIREAFLGVLGI